MISFQTTGCRGLIICAALGLTGCSWQDPLPTHSTSAAPLTVQQPGYPETPQSVIGDRLLEHFSMWEGVPYRYGGNTQDGIDCSAFVQQTARAVMGVNLPRTTAKQMRAGQAIDRRAARAGDMVFFTTGKNVRHVGVYLGSDKFMHASKRRGVTISRLDDRYWASRMTQIRRLYGGE